MIINKALTKTQKFILSALSITKNQLRTDLNIFNSEI